MEGMMPRYVVLDVHWVDDYAVTFGSHTGQQIDRFHTLECGRALALQRMANGDLGTIVVDSVTGECVYPPPEDQASEADGEPASGTREQGEAGEQGEKARVKSAG
jgi:hypothetical protein